MDLKSKVNVVLYNNSTTSFDDVTLTLRVVFGFDREQAEQCTLLTHYKGKYTIKESIDLKDALIYQEMMTICNSSIKSEIEVLSN